MFSYLIDKKSLIQNDAEEIFYNIINNELKNGLDKKIHQKEFSQESITKIAAMEINSYRLSLIKVFRGTWLMI